MVTMPLSGHFCALIFEGAFLALSFHPVVEDLTGFLNCLQRQSFENSTLKQSEMVLC